MLTSAMGADLSVLDGGIVLKTILAVGDGIDALDDHLGILEDGFFLDSPVPAVFKQIGDHRGDLADLHGDTLDFGETVFFSDLVDLFNRMKDNA